MRRPVSPDGATTSPAPGRTSLPMEARSEARAMIRRSGVSARAVKVMNTLAAPESTAQIRPRARSMPGPGGRSRVNSPGHAIRTIASPQCLPARHGPPRD